MLVGGPDTHPAPGPLGLLTRPSPTQVRTATTPNAAPSDTPRRNPAAASSSRSSAALRTVASSPGAAMTTKALDLAEEISSHRATGPLRELAASMGEQSAVPAVRAFRERIATTIAA